MLEQIFTAHILLTVTSALRLRENAIVLLNGVTCAISVPLALVSTITVKMRPTRRHRKQPIKQNVTQKSASVLVFDKCQQTLVILLTPHFSTNL